MQETQCAWETEGRTCWCEKCEQARSEYEEYLYDLYKESR